MATASIPADVASQLQSDSGTFTPKKRKLDVNDIGGNDNDSNADPDMDFNVRTDIDSDSETEEGGDPPRNSKNFRPTCHYIEKYTFPVLIEDIGKGDLKQEKMSDYEFDLNRLFTLAQVGRVRATRRVAPGKFIVDCQSQSQRQSLLPKKHLRTPANGYIPIQCRIPQPVTEGVIGPITQNVPLSSIQEKVDEYNDNNTKIKISKCRRVTKFDRDQKTVVDTAFIHLTFECPTLPESIYLGTTLYGVSVYRRDPILCSNCHLLGHTKTKCKRQTPLCGKCLQDRHPCGDKECPLPKSDWFCRNCKKKGHSASWPRCPQKLIMKKALEIQAATYMPLSAAVSMVIGNDSGKSQIKASNLNRPNRPTSSNNYGTNYPMLSQNRTARSLNLGVSGAGPPLHSKDPGGEEEIIAFDATNPTPRPNRPSANTGLGSSSQSNSNAASSMSNTMEKRLNEFMIENEKKFKSLSNKLDSIYKQKEEQLKVIEQFVQSKKVNANPSEKAVLDILDVFRKAAQGSPDELFSLAKKFSKSGCDISDDLKTEISVLTQNINF